MVLHNATLSTQSAASVSITSRSAVHCSLTFPFLAKRVWRQI